MRSKVPLEGPGKIMKKLQEKAIRTSLEENVHLRVPRWFVPCCSFSRLLPNETQSPQESL